MADAPTARRLTAVFCANDLLALGVLQEMTPQVVFEPELVVRQSSHAKPRSPRRTRRPQEGTRPAARPAVPDRAG